jgi:hypothetical protein
MPERERLEPGLIPDRTPHAAGSQTAATNRQQAQTDEIPAIIREYAD